MANTVLDIEAIEDELVAFLRNRDVLTTTQRGVTTTAATGTFAGETSLLINVANAKNVRSVVVASVTLTFGTDYTYDATYSDSGTYKLRIAFTAAQTGAYTITYDFGTDKIYPDFPRDDLDLSSYPRIAVQAIAMNTQDFGVGANEKISEILFTIVVYANKKRTVNQLIKTIRGKFMDYQNSFFNLRYIRTTATGPLIEPEQALKNEILHRNIDFVSRFNVEKVV